MAVVGAPPRARSRRDGRRRGHRGRHGVTILEVAGSGESDDDIRQTEQLWMKKLQSRALGLGLN